MEAVEALLETRLFQQPVHGLGPNERMPVTVAKAQKVAEAYGMSLDDIATLSSKFWEMHAAPFVCENPATIVLLSIQYNLVLGTILDHVGRTKKDELSGLLEDLLKYRVSGQFCLTELDHGLDAANLETTAEMLEDGSGFVLNTPHPGAAKFMPPVVPCGIPCVGLVMARLIEHKKDLGVRPFLVNLSDGKDMLPGIVTRVLPYRGGSSPVWHSITSFHNLRIPLSALLVTRKVPFQQLIWRAAVGSISLAATALPAIAHAAFIAAKYSQRRLVLGRPVIEFPTQHGPILDAFAKHFVFVAFYRRAAKIFADDGVERSVRHGIAACFKAVVTRDGQDAMIKLSERCGAQGLFNYNMISQMHADLRGNAVAEGDILVLSIRLVTELLLNRYALDPTFFAGFAPLDSPLAHHAAGLLATARAALQGSCKGLHRSEEFSQRILPQCTKIVEAIGMHYAYASAVSAGLDARITRLYLASALKEDQSWYVEHMGMKREDMFAEEVEATRNALPLLDEWMASCGAEKFVKAPIVDRERWVAFVGSLEVFDGSRRSRSEMVSSRL
uniref:Acyl-CoA dehydrogenase NM domain-like protein n=1 Tax=Mycena chlorophos TaxID=658473 RepID=A0ABQ0KYP7_MYCCL|nr:acyl-CoA dehydrogenase NM domain-like protein [Mycena chlorophos]